jgi:RNA polymerase sigma-70 factor (ECF subfamily)
MAAHENTERLIIRWRSGSREAGDQLLRRYVPVLAGYFGRRSGSNADELVQRTLIACIRGVERFEGRSTFRSFLLGIARNQLSMYQRAEAFAGRESVPLPTRPEEGPSQLAAVRQEHLILIGALRRIDRDFSTVLRKFYWEEQSIDEIAAELDIAPGTVKSRLSRGRAALRAELLSLSVRENVREEALRALSSWLATRAE